MACNKLFYPPQGGIIMKQRKLMCICALFIFTLSGTSVYAVSPDTGKTIGKQNSDTSVLVEPTGLEKINPETKVNQTTTRQQNKTTKQNTPAK